MHCWNYQQPHSQEGGGVTFYVHPIFQRCHMSCPWPCCVIKDSVKGLGLDQWPWSSKSLTLSLYFLSLWPCNFKPRDLQKIRQMQKHYKIELREVDWVAFNRLTRSTFVFRGRRLRLTRLWENSTDRFRVLFLPHHLYPRADYSIHCVPKKVTPKFKSL